jgi:hypothetical protein
VEVRQNSTLRQVVKATKMTVTAKANRLAEILAAVPKARVAARETPRAMARLTVLAAVHRNSTPKQAARAIRMIANLRSC